MNISGRTDIVITSINYTDAAETTPTGTIAYTISAASLADAVASAPEIGSQTEFFPDVQVEVLGGWETRRILLKNRSFNTTAGGAVISVTLTYGVIDGDSVGTGLEQPGEKTYSMNCSEGSASILLHPKFADVPESEKIVAKALLDGTKPFDNVWRHKTKLILSSSKPEDADANWHPQETLEQAIASVVKTDAGKMLIDKIKKGVTTYATENVTWTETSYATSVNAAPSDLAKIDSPAGNPPSISGNWRLTGTTAKKSESGRFWEITKTWTASDAGAKWDTDLYS